jgi:hypothetical protein
MEVCVRWFEPGRSQDLRARLLLAFAGACVAAVALYALLRLVQALLFKEPNPATVIWSAHAGYLWRVWTVSYAGAMTGFATFAGAGKRLETVARVLLWGLAVATGLIVVQGILVP